MRQYLIGSWNNADQYDYSGEQLMGSRHAGRSVCVDHILPNGKANLSRYGDIDEKPKKKTIPITHKIIPQQKTLDRLEAMQKELEDEYSNGRIELTEYLQLSAVLEKKLDRAYQLLEKALGWDKLTDDELSNLEYKYIQKNAACDKPQPSLSEADKAASSINESWVIENDNSIFMQLSVDNSFRKLYLRLKKAKQAFQNVKHNLRGIFK